MMVEMIGWVGSCKKYLVHFVVDGFYFSRVLAQKLRIFIALSVVVSRINPKIRKYFVLMRLDPDLTIAKNHIKLVISDRLPVSRRQIVHRLRGHIHQHAIFVRGSLRHKRVLRETSNKMRG